MRKIGGKNTVVKSMLGQGYYNCVTPAVIQRNIFENPGWSLSIPPTNRKYLKGDWKRSSITRQW